MSEKPETSVLGGLPHSRSHRRSDKRAARPAAATAPERGAPHPEPEATGATQPGPEATAANAPWLETDEFSILGTAVQAVGELAEIGLTLTARLLRTAVSRLPHP